MKTKVNTQQLDLFDISSSDRVSSFPVGIDNGAGGELDAAGSGKLNRKMTTRKAAMLKILNDTPETAHNIRVCQWCNGLVKPTDKVYLGQGPTGTKYLVCQVCFDDTKRINQLAS